VTCLEVRERLAEYALGLLPRAETVDVDRHLEWCAGCRKEAGELQEGAAAAALSVPLEEPPSALEHRVVERLRFAAGTAGPAHHRHRLRGLVAATLAAAILAVGAMGWAVAERQHVQTLQVLVQEKNIKIQDVEKVIQSFQGRGKTLEAALTPPAGQLGSGTAVVFTAPRVNDLVLLEAVLLPDRVGPFVVQIVTEDGAIRVGNLQHTTNGDWIMFHYTEENLSGVLSVTILDGTSNAILTGIVHQYAP
jgi:hypothetical protein